MRLRGALGAMAVLCLLLGCGASTPPVDSEEIEVESRAPDEAPEGFEEDADAFTESCLSGLWALDTEAWAEEIAHIFTVQAGLDAEVTVTGAALWELSTGSYIMDVGVLESRVDVDLDGLAMQNRFVVTGVDAGGWTVSGDRLRLRSDGGSIETILLVTVGGIEANEDAPVPLPLPWSAEMTVDCLGDRLEVAQDTGSSTVFVTYTRVE